VKILDTISVGTKYSDWCSQ